MKTTIILFTLNLLTSCSASKNMKTEQSNTKKDFINVTQLIHVNTFEDIKKCILENGDTITYRNIDNNNPHYKFKNCDAFLGADIGLKNVNNNPEISDFNQLTLKTSASSMRYLELILVRKGDIEKEKWWIKKGMKEQQVYLIDNYNKGLDKMMIELPIYLEQILLELKTNSTTKPTKTTN